MGFSQMMRLRRGEHVNDVGLLVEHLSVVGVGVGGSESLTSTLDSCLARLLYKNSSFLVGGGHA